MNYLKMTKLYILISLAFVVVSCVKPTTVSFTEDEYYSKVFDNLPHNKNELFLRSNKWMVSNFKSAKDVIQFSDKEEGTIVGKYIMYYQAAVYNGTPEIEASSLIEITVKDNKARIQIKPGSWVVYEDKTTTAGQPKRYVVENGVKREADPVPGGGQGFTKAMAKKQMEELGESFYKALMKEKDDF